MGKATEVELDQPVPLRDLLNSFREDEPELTQFIKLAPQDTRPRGIVVMRGSDMLELADQVGPGDRLEILVAIQGG
ncbi:MAG: MoaD/ThiS family protein [Rhodospirillales bacterium]